MRSSTQDEASHNAFTNSIVFPRTPLNFYERFSSGLCVAEKQRFDLGGDSANVNRPGGRPTLDTRAFSVTLL